MRERPPLPIGGERRARALERLDRLSGVDARPSVADRHEELHGADGLLRGAIRLGEEALPLGPVNVSTNPEWTFDRSRREQLSAVSLRSGGEPRVDLSDVWTAPRPTALGSIRRWLIPALLLLILLEALQTQTGWTLRLRWQN